MAFFLTNSNKELCAGKGIHICLLTGLLFLFIAPELYKEAIITKLQSTKCMEEKLGWFGWRQNNTSYAQRMLRVLLNKVVRKVTYLFPLLAVTLSISYAPLPLHKPRRCLHIIPFHSWLNLHWEFPSYYAYIQFCILSPLKKSSEPQTILREAYLLTAFWKRIFLVYKDAKTQDLSSRNLSALLIS